MKQKLRIERINKTKRRFFGKINKIDKPLARLTKNKREDSSKSNQKWKGRIYMDITEIQRFIRDYYKQPHANKMDSFKKWTNSKNGTILKD